MNRPIQILIVDDEAPARTRLRNLLEDIVEQLPNQVLAEACDGVDALEKLDGIEVDAVLVDIRMPRMDGLELVRHLAGFARAPAVIFVTAYDQYAVQAFELSAVDYLLKPVRAERLAEALRKALRAPAAPTALRQASETIAPGGRRQLRCSERGKVLLVPVAEVVYFKAEQKYVTARTREREFLLEESLAQLETEYEQRFLRVHRNCLVAREAIAGFEREHEAAVGIDGEVRWVVLLKGIVEKLRVSRRQWPMVKAAVEG